MFHTVWQGVAQATQHASPRVIKGYVGAMLRALGALAEMVENETAEQTHTSQTADRTPSCFAFVIQKASRKRSGGPLQNKTKAA